MIGGAAAQGVEPAVLRLYDVLLQRQPNSLVALNRAIAVDHVDGPAAALAALDAIPQADDLTGDVNGYVYFHTARADVLARLDRHDDAAAALDRAIECSTNESERSFLRRRRQDLGAPAGQRGHRHSYDTSPSEHPTGNEHRLGP